MVHFVFCAQLLIAVPRYGLVLPEFGIVFFPHTLLLYFIGPYPFHDQSIDWTFVVVNMLVTLPMSLIYGFPIPLGVYVCKQARAIGQSKPPS